MPAVSVHKDHSYPDWSEGGNGRSSALEAAVEAAVDNIAHSVCCLHHSLASLGAHTHRTRLDIADADLEMQEVRESMEHCDRMVAVVGAGLVAIAAAAAAAERTLAVATVDDPAEAAPMSVDCNPRIHSRMADRETS